MSRRTDVSITINDIDVTSALQNYLISLSYMDNMEGEADDLQISLQDRNHDWLGNWLNSLDDNAKIKATIAKIDWNGSGSSVLDCGAYELDEVVADGPPSIITIKATSIPFSNSVQRTKKSQAWESYYLSGIAQEIAKRNSMTSMFLSQMDPWSDRTDQSNQSDIVFLAEQCKKFGLSVKVTSNTIVVFDSSLMESKKAVATVSYGDGSYIKYKMVDGNVGTKYGKCVVKYTNPSTGKVISGSATDDEGSESQVLCIYEKVSSISEAKKLASKHLRECNKNGKTATFTMYGRTDFVAGQTILLNGFSKWNGRYIITSAEHEVNDGYTTTISLRKTIGGTV